MWRLEPSVNPRCLESVGEYLKVGSIDMAITIFVRHVSDIGYSDEEIDRYADELETIGRNLHCTDPSISYQEAVNRFRRNARCERDPSPYQIYVAQLKDWMLHLESCVEPRFLEAALEELQVHEITEAIRCFASGVYDIGYTDEQIDCHARELESICTRLQTVAPFVYYGEAVRVFRRNARQK
jgi:hypothetical protein